MWRKLINIRYSLLMQMPVMYKIMKFHRMYNTNTTAEDFSYCIFEKEIFV